MAGDKRYQAGTAWIKVAPDFRGWNKQVRKEVNDSLNNLQARASLDKSSARATRRDLEKQLKGIDANVGVALSQKELKKAKKDLDGIASKHRRIATIEAQIDSAHARQQIRDLGGDFNKLVVSPKVHLDSKSITKQFDRISNNINKQANVGMVLPAKTTKNVLDSSLRADLLTKKLEEARKEVERLDKARGKIRNALDADREKGQIPYSKMRTMIETELKLEKALRQVRKEFDKVAKSSIAANNALARDESEMVRRFENAANRMRRKKEVPTRLRAEPGDEANFTQRVRQRRDSKAGRSKLKEDIVAFDNADEAAGKLDREIAKLEQSERALEHAHLAVNTAQLRVNEAMEKGIIASKEGIAATTAHTRALRTLEKAAATKSNQELFTARAREDFNRTADVLEDRLNTNVISRWVQQLEMGSAQGITAFTNRLVYAGRVVSSFVVLGSAAGAAIGGLGLINLAPLVGTLGQVAGALGLLPGMAAAAGTAIAAIAVGVSGIGGAFKAATKLSDAMDAASGGSIAADNSKAIRNAQRGVASANKAAARTAAQGARQIADAEKGVQDAQKGSQRAQKDLTQARKDAADQNDELRESIRDMALEEEDAALSVEEARERLGEVLRDPESTRTQRRRANLSYRQALEAQRDLRKEHKKTKEEFADSQRKGIEGSDVVVAAQERVAEAAAGVVEAQQRVVDAQQQASEANADAQERVVEAQENLAEAMTTAAGGGSAATKALEEYERELAKLHPQAQALVRQIMGMKDSWQDLRNSVQGRLFAGIAQDVRELAEKQLPLLQHGLGKTAEGINVGMRSALTYLRTDKASADFGSIFDNSAIAAEHFSVSLSSMLRALVPVAEVGSDFMPWFGRSLDDTARKWRIMAEQAQNDGSMEMFFAKSINRAQQYGRIITDIGGGMFAMFRSVTGMGEQTLNRTEARINAWRERLETSTGGEGVSNWFARMQTLFSGLLGIAGDLAQIIVTHVVPAFQMISDVVGPIIGVFVHLSSVLLDTLPILQPLLTAFLAFKIVDTVVTLGAIAMAKLNAAMGAQAGMFASLRTGWTTATTGVAGYTTALGRAHMLQQRMMMSPNPMIRQVGQYGAVTKAVGGVTTALGGLRGAASSMVGFLGGPWGVAMLAVVGGLGLWYSATQKTKQETKELEESTKRLSQAHRDYAKAVVESRGKVDGSVSAAAETIASERIGQIERRADDEVGFTDRFGSIFRKDYWSRETFFGDNAQSAFIDRKEKDNLDAKAEKEVLQELKIGSEELGIALSGTSDQWNTFKARLIESGEAGRRAAESFEQDRIAMQKQKEIVSSLDEGYLDLHEALATLNDTQSDAADKATALRQAFDALIPGNEQMEAMSKFGETMSDLRDAISQVDPEGGFGAEQLIGAGGVLNTQFANANTLLQLIKDGQQSIAEAQAAGASSQEVDQMWSDWRTQVMLFGDALQIPRDRMELLLSQMSATKEAVNIVVGVEGASSAQIALDEIRLKMDALGAQGKERTGTFAIGKQMRDMLEEIGATVKDLGGGYAEVTFHNQAVYDSFLQIQQAVQGNQADIDFLASKMKGLPTNGSFIVSDNSPAVLERLRLLGFTVRELPDGRIVATAETAAAETNLRALTITRNATILANVQKGSGWDHISDLMLFTENPEEWKRRRQQRQQQQQMPGWGGPWFNNKPPGGWRGMRLPGYAGGSRMPATGPGTGKRDGIYAVGPGGVPMAMVDGSEWVINARSSEKFDWLLNLINQDKLPGFAAGGAMGGRKKQGNFSLGQVGDPFGGIAGGVMNLGAAFGDAVSTAAPAWQSFGSTLASTASKFITPSLTAISSQVDTLGSLMPVVTQTRILAPWQNLANQMFVAKQTFIDPMFAGVSQHLTQMGAQFPAAAGIVAPSWVALSNQIMQAKLDTIDPTFTGINSGLANVQSAFGTAVPNIAAQWNGVREATAAPVRFTINTVFNDGLIGTWNGVADVIGGKRMTPKPAAFKRGGVLPGYTPGRDVHKFMSPTGGELHLSGGEAIMRPEWVRAVGGPAEVDRMNREARQGANTVSSGRSFKDRENADGTAGVNVGYGLAPGTNITQGAAGFPPWVYGLGQSKGVTASTYAGHQESNVSYPGFAPNPMGLNRGIDWWGTVPAMQAFAEYLLGIAPSTPALEQIIWQNPQTGMRIGWYGRQPDVSGSIFASDYPDHMNHVHTRQSGPLAPGMRGAPIAGMIGGSLLGGAMNMADYVKAMLDPGFDETKAKIERQKFPGSIGAVPMQAFEAARKNITDKAVKLAEQMPAALGLGAPGSTNYASGANIPGDVAEKVRRAFEPYGWGTGANWEAAKWIISHESSWNPTAVNPSSGAWGLFQFLGSTKDTYYPGTDPDPYKQGQAGARYIKDRYGSPLAAKAFWEQNNWYDRGGMWPSGTTGINMSGKTEAVFTHPQWKLLEKLVETLLHPKMFRALTDQKKVSLGARPTPAPEEKVIKMPEDKPETPEDDPATPDVDESKAAPPKREYAPAKVDPATGMPYETDPETGVPVDPATKKPFTVDPVTKKPIEQDDQGLFVDPETGKAFYGSKAETLDQKAAMPAPEDTFTFDNPAGEQGVPKEGEQDWVDEYSGPLSDVFKKAKLVGQLGNALAQPGAIQRIGNDKLMNEQIAIARQREDELNTYKTDQAAKINELRAQGKTAEAAALEKEARSKIATMSELPGTTKGTQAMLATMPENPGEDFRRKSEDEWKKYLGENWAGIAESAVAGGISGAQQVGGGAQVVVQGGIHTTNWSAAERSLERRIARQSRANARVGRR